MGKQINKPKLRFPEFTDEWKERRLEDLFSVFKSGQGITSTDIEEEGSFPVFGGNGLRGYSDKYTHEGEYFLIGRQGALCGNINRVNGKVFISEHAIACKANDTSSTEWLAQRLDYLNLNRLSESSAQPGLAVNKLLRLKLIAPCQSEQNKIANFLTAEDDKLNQLRKKKSLLEQYKKGVMQKLFSQELRFKDENGVDFKEWEEKTLGEVCVINPKNKSLPTKFVYIDLESVVDGVLIKEIEIELNGAPSRAQRLLQKGDVLFQMVRPYQKNNLYFDKVGDYVASTGYAQIRTNNSSMFIFQYLHYQKFVDKVIERCTGTSYPAINSTDLSNIAIEIPSLPEQTKIANFLSAIDEKINHCGVQIEKMEGWKKGLLQQMFV